MRPYLRDSEDFISLPRRNYLVKLSSRGKYFSASRRFGLLPQQMDPCTLTMSRCWLRQALLLLEEMPHRNRTAARWCFRSHGSLAPLQTLRPCMCPGPPPAGALWSMGLFEPLSC
jgi:hypothetical protein